jgi:hypothetical protein
VADDTYDVFVSCPRADGRHAAVAPRTSAPAGRPRKEAYLAILRSEPTQSLLVSLADKTHNAEAVYGRTRWYYNALAEVFSKAMPGRLSDRLLE